MNAKKTILWVVGIVGLGLTIVPSILVFNETIPLERHKQLMFLGMVIWFVVAPFVMNAQEKSKAEA